MTRSLRVFSVLLALTAFLTKEPVLSQTTLLGSVKDVQTGEPLEFVNVFLAGTTIGTSTGLKGHYQIRGVPAGVYQLAASRVGYEPRIRTIDISGAESLRVDILLRVREVRSGEVEVAGREPVDWKILLEKFTAAFIGNGANAGRCVILNPEVIDLRRGEEGDRLLASTDSVLLVENRALGYRIAIVLTRFSWDTRQDSGSFGFFPRFEPLTPSTVEQGQLWRQRRAETYEGSLRHFLYALTHRALEDSPFLLRSDQSGVFAEGRGEFPLPGEYLLRPDAIPGVLQFSFAGPLCVDFRGRIPFASSILRLQSFYARVDTLGNLLTPHALLVAGEWATDRVSDLLPFDWVQGR